MRVVFAEDGLVHPADAARYRVYEPLPAPPVTMWSASLLVERVLEGAGLTWPRRDAVGARIVDEVWTQTGQTGIGSEYPVLRGVSPPPDSDHDGMPDVREALHGLSPTNASDRNGDLNGDGYTNLEEYLNARDPRAPAAAPGGGAVPDDATVTGQPPTVQRAAGDRIALEWGASCREGDADDAVYEGSTGRFESHLPHHCSTGGATTLAYRPREGDLYLLIVPCDALREGSYGLTAAGTERPATTASRLPQEINPCP